MFKRLSPFDSGGLPVKLKAPKEIMELGLASKRALVVGSSKGIGRAIALRLAEEGATVTAVARTPELLNQLSRDLDQRSSRDHAVVTADVMAMDPAELARRLLQGDAQFDVVVHNVGGSLVSRNALGPIDEWRHAWQFNAGVAIAMNSVLVPPMVERGWGRVVHVSSISAVTLRGNPLYASAKAFLNAYVTTVGRTLAPSGVIFNAVMPGAVAFPGSYWDGFMTSDPQRVEDFLRHHQAAGRFGTPDEIANAVAFLASEQSSFMQGAIVPVDGANM